MIILSMAIPLDYEIFQTDRSPGVSALSGDLSAYWDENCTSPVTHIEWGTLEPAEKTNRSIYLKNEDSKALLSLDTFAWDPINAADYMNLTWDYDGTELGPGEVRSTDIQLSVSPDIEGISSFSFNIKINAASPYTRLYYTSVTVDQGPFFHCVDCGEDFFSQNYQQIKAVLINDFNGLVAFQCQNCLSQYQLYVALHRYEDDSIGLRIQKTDEEGAGGIPEYWWNITNS